MTQKLAALDMLLTQIMTAHTRVVLQWSGGKDSTLLLAHLRPWADRLRIVSNIVDGGFEGMEEHITTLAAQWGFCHLHIVRPHITFDTYVERFGWPSRLVPTQMDGTLPDPWYDGKEKVSSFWHCTVHRVLLPLLQKTLELGAEAMISGSRANDAPVFARQGPIQESWQRYTDGYTRYNPLHTWTASEVYAAIIAEGISLPPIYTHKQHVTWEFPDCVLCPYHHKYIVWLHDNRPDDYATLLKRWEPTARKALAITQEAMEGWLT